MRLTPFIAAASLTLAIAAPLAAQITPGTETKRCQDVLSRGDSTWVRGAAAELGTFEGLLNGSFLLSYDDEASTQTRAPNLFIKTGDGELRLWMTGSSLRAEDGTWTRKLANFAAEGTGAYAGAVVDLVLTGSFSPGKGGRYELVGTICPPME